MNTIARLKGLVPSLPRAAWTLLASDLLSALGTGMTLPFLVVYLHNVRGLSLSTAGLAVATVALASLIGNPLGGVLADRIAPRATLAIGLAIAAGGALALTEVGQTWQALAAAGLSGLGVSVAWPAQDTLLARLVPVERRSSVYAMRHATMNLGLAAGALFATVVVNGDPSSFVLLYRLDAATFLLAAAMLPLISVGVAHQFSSHDSAAPAGGYRAVARDRVFLRLWLLTALLAGVGLGQFNTTFPVYVTDVAGLSPRVLSAAFLANMVTVVVVQLLVLRLLRGRRRSNALVLVGVIWGATWAAVLLASQVGAGFAVLLFLSGAIAFGVGETLLVPAIPAIVNHIAPEHLRGRYNAGSTLAYTTGFVVGPAIAGLSLDHGYHTEMLIGLMLGCGLAATQARRLARHLPLRADIVDPSPGSPAGNGSTNAGEDNYAIVGTPSSSARPRDRADSLE